MTGRGLWQAVGEQLMLQRTRRGWKQVDVERRGGPTNKTVNEIENGRIGTVEKLELHARALDLDLIDVFRAVIETRHALSPDAAQLLRTFEQTTVEGRQALLATARALPLAEETPSGPNQSPPAPRASAKRKR